MYLPALAKDLYKAQKKVEQVEKELAATINVTEQESIKNELRQALAELAQLRKIMEGKKEQSRTLQHKPKPKNTFGL